MLTRLVVRSLPLFPLLLWPVSALAANEVPFTHVIVDASAPTNPHCKAVGDLNGDGFPDIAVASAAAAGLVWYSYPLWNERLIAPGSFTTDMQVADLDADLDLDIVTFDKDAQSVVWFENPLPGGDPTVDAWPRHVIGSAHTAHDVEVMDLDRDQKLDVVTREKGGGGTSVWFQVTPTSWIEKVVSREPGEGTALGDLDGDGDLDIVNNGFWVETPSDPRHSSVPWRHHVIDPNWPPDVGVHLADLDGDLRLEVIFGPSESSQGRLSWYDTIDPKRCLGPWREHVIDADVSYLHTFKTADMDGDGFVDLVTAEMHQSTDPDEVSIYFNRIRSGRLTSWRQQVVAKSGLHNLRVADIDLDGDTDIIGCNWSSDAPNRAPVEYWRNETVGGAPILVFTANRRRALAGQHLALTSTSVALPGAPVALLTSSFAGQPFVHLLAVARLSSLGEWVLATATPPGLAGLDIELQAAAIAPAGLIESNRAHIRFE